MFFFVRRFERYNAKSFSVIVSILVGSVITKLFAADKIAWWFYPIGLLIGLATCIYFAIRHPELTDMKILGEIKSWPWKTSKHSKKDK